MGARRPALVAVAIGWLGCHAVYPYGASEGPRDAAGERSARDLPATERDRPPAVDGAPDLPPPADGDLDRGRPSDADRDRPPAVDGGPADGPLGDLLPLFEQGLPDAAPIADASLPDTQAAPDQGPPSCGNECSYVGQQRCEPIAGATLQTCGSYDADTCLEWGAASPCPSGQVCNLGGDVCLPACYPGCACSPYDTRLCAVGECAGLETCTTAGAWGPCLITGAPELEICDGKDNDCNGVVDDNPTDTPPACLQADLCLARTAQCTGGAWVCVDTPTCAADELCLTGVCCCKGRECGDDPSCGAMAPKNVCGTCSMMQACTGGLCVTIH